ncbi:MAG: T9SS C-terminal target domain-containing protein [Saprospirales bacterium]|nr:MAG: T9SS C-terminal target domain-containing protein [Saprospirales bacterium]
MYAKQLYYHPEFKLDTLEGHLIKCKKLVGIFFLTIFCLYSNFGEAQTTKAFYIGHSLSDQIPDMVNSLSIDHTETSFDWVYQSIPGAPLRWQWQRMKENDYEPLPPHIYGFYHPTYGLPSGEYDILILTESVPRSFGPWGIEETMVYADSFYQFAVSFNPNIRVYLYEVWHCIESGTPTGCDYDIDSNPWTQRLADDLPMWESAVDYLNEKYQPEIPVCLIPGGQGLARLHQEIELGTVPGLTSVYELFSDNIHLSDIGKYFIACIHFAMIHNTSPVGLSHQLQVWWGGDFEAPTPEQALRFQEIALETVTQYPNSCYDDISSSTTTQLHQKDLVYLYPNPSSGILNISSINDNSNWEVFSVIGKLLKRGKGSQVNIYELGAGVYFIRIKGNYLKVLIH